MMEPEAEPGLAGAENPWTSNDLLLGVKLGDPRSGVVIARRCGLLGPQVCTLVYSKVLNIAHL